jgi:hypothetical protein
MRRRSGVCPPSNPSRGLRPARAFCPLWPRPEVLPKPDPIPRPTRLICSITRPRHNQPPAATCSLLQQHAGHPLTLCVAPGLSFKLFRAMNSRSGAWRGGIGVNHLQLMSCVAAETTLGAACCRCNSVDAAQATAGLLPPRHSWTRPCTNASCRCLIAARINSPQALRECIFWESTAYRDRCKTQQNLPADPPLCWQSLHA